MSTFLQRLGSCLPFTKSERIIIVIVVALHILPALEFIHMSTRPPKMDDNRVMANLVSPSPAKSEQAPVAPKAPPPKPKEESKKKLEEKPPTPASPAKQTEAAVIAVAVAAAALVSVAAPT